MITNFTEKESQITIEQLHCSGKVHGYLILLSVINIFLSITAFLGNTLILTALHKETPLSQLSDKWSLCWYYRGTSSCFLLDIWGDRTIGYLFIRLRLSLCHILCSVFFVFGDNNFYTPGQTSCPVARAQIQTSCNFEKNIFNYNIPLGYLQFRCNNVLCEPRCTPLVWKHRSITLFSHLNLFLYKNFSYPALQSHSATATRLVSTVKPSISTEHGYIQEGSSQCIVDTNNI